MHGLAGCDIDKQLRNSILGRYGDKLQTCAASHNYWAGLEQMETRLCVVPYASVNVCVQQLIAWADIQLVPLHQHQSTLL